MDVDPEGATWRKSTYSNGSGATAWRWPTCPAAGPSVTPSTQKDRSSFLPGKGGKRSSRASKPGSYALSLSRGKRQAFVAKVQVMTPHSLSAWAAAPRGR